MSCIYLGKKEYWDHIDNAARDVAAPVKRAGEVGGGRLKGLYALQAGMNAREIQKNQKTDKAINKNNAVGINISLGSTGWKDHAETITEETRGSTVTAGKTAAIIAKEDMTVKGSTVNAKDIHLKAGNNIHILSSENKSTTIEDYKAKSGSIGASLSKGGYGIGASYGKGKGQTEETTLTHTPSDITAKDTVSLSSGNDTLIRGGTVKGNKVIANAGRMSIESEQDKKNYKEKGKTSGLSISYTPGSAVTVSGGKGKTNTDSTYESVTKQAGIYAGKEGYDIQVKNNTRLKGAVIDSKAPAEKNKLTTGTLTWENIDNKAEYKASGKGISYSTGAGVPLNALGLLSNMVPTVKDRAGTTTKSAVSKGTLTITDKENQKQDITELNKDTENSLNKLKEIFDKTKVEEKQELIHMMNIVGNQIIHEAADHYGWKEGSTEKLLLHGAIGALTGTMSGGNALSGAVSGSVNEFALAYMEKTKGRDWMDTHPDTVQAISTALGAVAGSLTGDRNTGAYTAQMGTRWNYYEKYPNMKEKIEKYLSSDEYKQQKEGTAHVIYLDDSTEHGVIVTKDSDTGAGRIIDINSRSGETFSHLNPSGEGIRPYDKNVTFKRIDKGNDHPTGVYTFGEQDGTVVNGHALYPDEIKDWENYRRMKGIPMPNYTINKGTLAENMATATIEYPFALAETMGGNVSTARVLALGPLKTLGMYRTWQEDWKNYSGEDWWKAQGINIGVPLVSKGVTIATTTIDVTRLTDNPFIGAAMGIIMGMAVDEGGNEVAKTMKKDLLKTDAQKREEQKGDKK